ncbi:hypothetical protein CR513_59936, partial [Mucuna pruriens]
MKFDGFNFTIYQRYYETLTNEIFGTVIFSYQIAFLLNQQILDDILLIDSEKDYDQIICCIDWIFVRNRELGFRKLFVLVNSCLTKELPIFKSLSFPFKFLRPLTGTKPRKIDT